VSNRFAWELLGVDEGGLPVHLPMGVNQQGQGPEDDSAAHHFECWCGDANCPLTGALMAAFRKGRAEPDPIAGGSLP